jgi:hypothetical protein
VEERELQSKSGTLISRIFGAIGQLIRFFFRFIGKIIAVFLIFIGVVVAFAVFASLLAIFKLPGTHYPVFIDHIFPGGSFFGWGMFGAVLAVGIPFLLVAYLGVRMLFKVKKYPRGIGMAALSLWIIGILICIYVGVRTAGEFSQKQNVTSSISFAQPKNNNLILAMDDAGPGETKRRYWNNDDDWDDEFRLSIENDQLQSKSIKIDILRSPTDSFKLEQIFYARGSSKKDAADRAAKISYTVTQTDSLLKFGNFFVLNKDEKWRDQKIQLVLYVPEGAEIYLHPSLSGYIYDIENVMNILDHDMLGKHWKMTNAGLECIDCDGEEESIGIPKMRIHKAHGSVRIDDNGVFIDGEGDEFVHIDSNGVVVKHKGQEPTIIRKR